MDATFAPADIRYPTDLSLLNEASADSEAIIDVLYAQLRGSMNQKPRTYRQLAHQVYLIVAKQR